MAAEPNAKPSKLEALWKFADSPFTWGGIGVVIGSAIVTPVWFRYAFIGAGISIGVGLIRAGILDGRHVAYRVIGQIALLLCLVVGWWSLWRVIPKPEEPLTKKSAQELLEKWGKPTFPQQSPQPPASYSDKPVTVSELAAMLRQVKPPTQSETPKPVASMVGLPRNAIEMALRNEGEQMIKDFYDWYDDEDEPLSLEPLRIAREVGTSEATKNSELARVSTMRAELKSAYDQKCTNGAMEINPIRAEAVRLLSQAHAVTKEDQEAETTFDAFVSGRSKNAPCGMGWGAYLKGLGKRLIPPPPG
jgi:hypothetical protein